MEINTQELHLIYKQIKAAPETWFQQTWAKDFERDRALGWFIPEGRCGTAYCFAGHAVVRAGYKIAWRDDSTFGSCDFAVDEQGAAYAIGGLAEEILGLEDYEADELFCGTNHLDDIRNIITNLTGMDPED